jgi:hypothetical protein
MPPIISAVLSEMNKGQTLNSYFFKIRFNIILPSNPGSSEWPVMFRFFDYFVYMNLFLIIL